MHALEKENFDDLEDNYQNKEDRKNGSDSLKGSDHGGRFNIRPQASSQNFSDEEDYSAIKNKRKRSFEEDSGEERVIRKPGRPRGKKARKADQNFDELEDFMM